MSYTPTTWVAGVTKLGPTNLNHLEGGVQAAAAVADAALPTPAGTNGQFLKRVGGVWVPTSFAASDIPSFPTDVTKALLGDGSWAQIANAQIAAAAAIAGSKLATGLTGPPGAKLSHDEITANVNVVATTETTATTVVTASAVTFDGVTPVIVEFYAAALNRGTTTIALWLYDGASSIGQLAFSTGSSEPVLVRRRLTPSAAAHTFSIRGTVDAGTGSVSAGVGGLGAVAPAFIRIVKE